MLRCTIDESAYPIDGFVSSIGRRAQCLLKMLFSLIRTSGMLFIPHVADIRFVLYEFLEVFIGILLTHDSLKELP